MKTLLASVVSVLCGLALGWYVAHGRAEREKTEIVQEMVSSIVAAHGEHAGRAVRAIQMIESGKTQEAVQLLSGPIARYYSIDTAGTGGDERTAKLRALIEQLAKANLIVASRIAEASSNQDIRR
jgi:hypothetical protein